MSENIGSILNTKIPAYEDAADIQAALKLYHYGSTDYNTANTDPTQLPNPSIARHIQTIKDNVALLQTAGIGSDFAATEPTSPPDGFIWVDSTTTAPVFSGIVVPYQNTAPASPVNGTIWIDSTNGSALVLKVYDSASSSWKSVSV